MTKHGITRMLCDASSMLNTSASETFSRVILKLMDQEDIDNEGLDGVRS
jgi:hypothetical protein